MLGSACFLEHFILVPLLLESFARGFKFLCRAFGCAFNIGNPLLQLPGRLDLLRFAVDAPLLLCIEIVTHFVDLGYLRLEFALPFPDSLIESFAALSLLLKVLTYPVKLARGKLESFFQDSHLLDKFLYFPCALNRGLLVSRLLSFQLFSQFSQIQPRFLRLFLCVGDMQSEFRFFCGAGLFERLIVSFLFLERLPRDFKFLRGSS